MRSLVAKGYDRARINIFHISSSVGRLILTKSVGSDIPEDITFHYKDPEGSPEERLAVFNAVRGVDR
jgi:hypothetical protein